MFAAILLALTAAIIFGGAKRNTEPDEPEGPHDMLAGKPIKVGQPDDPEIAALLAEMDALFAAHGARNFTARELTTMRSAPGKPVAIPPRNLWPRMAKTIEVIQPLRDRMGIPLKVRSGYRATDFNKAVGGAPKSQHVFFSAVDLTTDSRADRARLALEGAKIFKELGSKYRIGFGAYGKPTPSNIHIDTGWNRRTWREAQHFLSQV